MHTLSATAPSVFLAFASGFLALAGGSTGYAQEQPPTQADNTTRQDPQTPLDLVIHGGAVHIDADTPPQRMDIAVRDGRIERVGADLSSERQTAKRTLDATGFVVAPGFIDVHTHADRGAVNRPKSGDARNFTCMGVTTIVTGNCGSSTDDLAAHFRRVERQGISVNYASLIGHGTVRRAVLGTENRAPTAAELTQMCDLVRTAMDAGAVGLSTGLIYVPGTYAAKDELIALCRVVAEYGGVYATHMRSEAGGVLRAIDEALDIGFQSGVHVHLSHLKASGKPNWGRSRAILSRMRSARALGQKLTGDQYAYCASSTGLEVLVPREELSIGLKAFGKKVQTDPDLHARMLDALAKTARVAGFDDSFHYAQIARAPAHPELNGLRIDGAAKALRGETSLRAQSETILQLLADADGRRVQMVYHKMCEDDLTHLLSAPFLAIASDAGIRNFTTQAKPHPRGSGNNPRVLGRYVRERGSLSLPQAIDKMTRLPAEIFGLEDRGVIRPGAFADFTIFDPETIADRATYAEPLALPDGIRWVIVHGETVVEDGIHTGARPGQVLRHEPTSDAPKAIDASTPRNEPKDH